MSLDEILRVAKGAGASDVHLSTNVPPKMRVNGFLEAMWDKVLQPGEVQVLLEKIMDDVHKERYQKKGTCDFSYAIPDQGRYRVNVYKQRGSMAAAIRLVSWEIPTPEKLGIPDVVMEMSRKKKGLILVTGAGGSGRSNTLAAFIGKVNTERNCHVMTIEDPIEFLHQHNMAIVNQRELGIDVATYKAGITDALRENADVIMIGEITEDYESVSAALAAAESGKLVISTMHTKDVVTTIERMMDVFPREKQRQVRIQLSNNLKAVFSQQLLPSMEGAPVAAFEALVVDENIKGMIRSGKTHELYSAMKISEVKGVCTMDEAILQLFYDGKIDREVAISYAYDPVKMETII